MNKPVRPPDTFFIPPSLAARFQPLVDNGVFETVGEAIFVAASAFADRMEFGVTDDVEAIRLSIEKSIEEDDYIDAEVVFAELHQRYGESGD